MKILLKLFQNRKELGCCTPLLFCVCVCTAGVVDKKLALLLFSFLIDCAVKTSTERDRYVVQDHGDETACAV